MLMRSICAMFSSCLVLVTGCGSSGTDPVIAGNGGTPGNGGATATGSGGATTSSSTTGGTNTATATGGVSNTSGGSSSATGGAVTSSGGSPGQGGSAVGGASVSTGGATTKGGSTATGGANVGGGATATGGKADTGGTATAGGASAGGSVASGGKAAGGTTTATGGAATSTGGVTAAGGSTADSSGCRVWLATDGSDTAAGTQAAPVATLLHAYDLVCPPPASGSAAGSECTGASPRTICVKAGTYAMSTRFEFKKTRMGTSSNRIIVQADPNGPTKPILDFGTQPRVSCGANPSDGNLGGITVNADYVTLKNLEIKGANDNCIKVQGTNGLIEGVVAHGCADAGIQISSGSGYTGSGTNNTVLNCDSYQNNDTQCNGENADGFAVKEGTGTGNVFRGCRAWDNADDGWDLYAWTSPVTIENCWAVSQCKTTKGSSSDGNGFKLGGDDVSATHVLKDLVAVDNNYGSSACGFTENSNPASMTCTGSCYSWGNKTNVDTIGGTINSTAPNGATATSMVAASARNTDGSLKAITAL